MRQWFGDWWQSHRSVATQVAVVLLIEIVTLEMFDGANLIKVHDEKLRIPFFASFLTLAGFLLSLKTFVIVKMKELVYDDPFYAKAVKDMCSDAIELEAASREHYYPLRRLSELLFAAILCSFVASALQVSIGFLASKTAVIICIGAATVTVYLLVYSLLVTRRNLNYMFQLCEEKMKRQCEGDTHKCVPAEDQKAS
ncbi:MAG TPA: hypothetical protein P5081_16955 [Phycisphaerae bacterium]|nr:hypothetical protein [Phycisphaerae bacterium]HRW54562.1 hypothetical protein [Phycisphaerae bacterium]